MEHATGALTAEQDADTVGAFVLQPIGALVPTLDIAPRAAHRALVGQVKQAVWREFPCGLPMRRQWSRQGPGPQQSVGLLEQQIPVDALHLAVLQNYEPHLAPFPNAWY